MNKKLLSKIAILLVVLASVFNSKVSPVRAQVDSTFTPSLVYIYEGQSITLSYKVSNSSSSEYIITRHFITSNGTSNSPGYSLGSNCSYYTYHYVLAAGQSLITNCTVTITNASLYPTNGLTLHGISDVCIAQGNCPTYNAYGTVMVIKPTSTPTPIATPNPTPIPTSTPVKTVTPKPVTPKATNTVTKIPTSIPSPTTTVVVALIIESTPTDTPTPIIIPTQESSPGELILATEKTNLEEKDVRGNKLIYFLIAILIALLLAIILRSKNLRDKIRKRVQRIIGA
jgi:hypothetical protein